MTLSTSATRRAVLALLIATGAVYDSNFCHLYAPPHAFSNSDTIATLSAIEATFGGYSPSGVLVWGEIADQADGSAISYSQLVQFTCTDSVTPQDINGYYLAAGVAGPPVTQVTLTGQLSFVDPQPARAAFDPIFVQPTLVY